ncbi:hypothetical protein D3C85_1325370 [compost metagenome]
MAGEIHFADYRCWLRMVSHNPQLFRAQHNASVAREVRIADGDIAQTTPRHAILHLRRENQCVTEKQRGLFIYRPGVNLHWRADLGKTPVTDDRNLAGKRQRFLLIVRHQNRGDTGLFQ